MRVLALTNLYPNPFQPHRAPFVRHQLRLLNDNHPVRVIAPVAWTDELRARLGGKPRIPADRQLVHDQLAVTHPRFVFPPRLGRRWYGWWFARSVRGRFAECLREFRPHVVFAPWAYPDGWTAVRLAHRAGLPAVIQVHGSDVRLLDQHPGRRRPTADALTRADGVIAVSRDLADRAVSLGTSPHRVRVIRDGVDPAVFHPGSKDAARERVGLAAGLPVVLFVGNLVPVKAVDVLLTAVARLPVRLIVAGDGPLRRRLERLAEQLGVRDRITFLGSRPQPELADWFRAADLFVLPSHSEGTPNVLLEASACGTPWVASAVGGIPDLLDAGAARLVPPGDPAALAGAIALSLNEPPRPPVPAKPRVAAVTELADFLEAVVAGGQAQSLTSSKEAVLPPWPGAADPPLRAAYPAR